MLRELKAPKNIKELKALDGLAIILPSPGDRIIIYDLGSGARVEHELPSLGEDLEIHGGEVWISLPAQGLIISLDPSSLEIVQRIRAHVAHGVDSFSILDRKLWAILSDHRTLMLYDLESGSNRTRRFDEGLEALKPYPGGALIATGDDKIIEVDESLNQLRSWRLKNATAVDIALHRLEDGRIIYAALARWVIGEIEGDEVEEVKVEGRIGGVAAAEDGIWFTEPGNRRIGWISYSRPPRILEIRVEKLEPTRFKASVKAIDPDSDLKALNLTIKYPSQIPGVPGLIKRLRMEEHEGIWVAQFSLKPGERVKVSAEALDEAGNVGKGMDLEVFAEISEGVETTEETVEEKPVAQLDPYLVGSSLILLIPIIFALIFYRLGRRRRRRRR